LIFRQYFTRCQNQNSLKSQYLVCPPLTWITAKQRRLILFIGRLMTRKGVCAHSSCNARSMSLTLLTSFCSHNRWLRWSHMYSIGDRSGDLEGHSSVLMLFAVTVMSSYSVHPAFTWHLCCLSVDQVIGPFTGLFTRTFNCIFGIIYCTLLNYITHDWIINWLQFNSM